LDRHHEESGRPAPAAGEPKWREALAKLERRGEEVDRLQEALTTSEPIELRYHLNLRESRLRDRLVLDLMRLDAAGQPRPVELADGDPSGLGAEDAEIAGLLFGAHGEVRTRGHHAPDAALGRCSVRPGMYRLVLPKLARTGRLYADLALPGVAPSGPLGFEGDPPFDVHLVVRAREAPEAEARYRMWGALVREGGAHDLEAPRLLLSDGLALVGEQLVLVRPGEGLDWALRLRRHGAVEFPAAAKDGFLLELARMPDLPPLDLPAELHWSQVAASPVPKVVFSLDEGDAPEPREAAGRCPHVIARVLFDYGGTTVPVNAREAAVVDEKGRRLFRRDLAAERAHAARLGALEVALEGRGTGEIRLPKRTLPELVRQLVDAGWSVESDGAEVRAGSTVRAKVKSGIDWFDLDASVEFAGGATVKLPELLRAAAAGKQLVCLSDGSRGFVPEWVKRYASLARVGQTVGTRLRFLPSQAGVIDALLAGFEHTEADVKFERLREQLQTAADPSEIVEPPGFKGRLRDYQRAGVAWMRFLEAHGYGGCLADDMGLGKTVQMLCALQARHLPGPDGERKPPSLVIVPKSLIHNWVSEAKKFTELEVVDFTGAGRAEHADRLHEVDLVVTTYGTLRQEILRFTEMRFTSLILDEAQAIKNPRSQAAKACRLVQAEHRLAISGTPIENGLEELWSLFEFLNPGMLGGLGDFAAPGRERDEQWLESLSRALKPFMLRRTKEQVLHELPGKTEQPWEVPLGEEERKRYDELRQYYRSALQGVLEQEGGLEKARIHVLEALLRLRQAACHPGLVDPGQLDAPSAKIDALFHKLHEIVPRGHKALVFSQFTTLLEIVKRRLEREGFGYAYLDGGTADRRKTVSEFTDNESCAVFLISLKAGGCGLNLTQSDYVFILDPWWNPAIEAQAVDRAHRMGQKNKVFAYKMIAKGTVEEKIVALQTEKRRLADAIVTADAGPLKGLDAADLDALL
jgi:superfamily II DNA or RNA helicase